MNNQLVSVLLIAILFASCSVENQGNHSAIDKYAHFTLTNEIEINDSCIYLMHPSGYVDGAAIIEINLNKQEYNTSLLEFDESNINGTKLKIKQSYQFQLSNLEFSNIEQLGEPDDKLIEKYRTNDSIVYFDYTFYFPKKDKLFWVNVYDGIDENERLVLEWIKKNITKISVKENINYRMLTENIKDVTQLSVDSLNRRYIIPEKELTGIPLYLRLPK